MNIEETRFENLNPQTQKKVADLAPEIRSNSRVFVARGDGSKKLAGLAVVNHVNGDQYRDLLGFVFGKSQNVRDALVTHVKEELKPLKRATSLMESDVW